MTLDQNSPQEEIQLPEPNCSEEVLTKDEINKKIKYFWSEIDKSITYDAYAESFKQLDYYRDLKQKLYK